MLLLVIKVNEIIRCIADTDERQLSAKTLTSVKQVQQSLPQIQTPSSTHYLLQN